VKRSGFTFVEMMVATGILTVAALVLFQMQSRGARVLDSNSRKVTAARRAHEGSEALRRKLAAVHWVWLPGADAAPVTTGSDLMYSANAGEKSTVNEYQFSPDDKQLVQDGLESGPPLSHVSFSRLGSHVLRYVVRADEHGTASDFQAFRERSTLVSAVYLQQEDEEDRFANFVLEPQHQWCLRGLSIHYGIDDQRGTAR
jgi:prepilin-type N-terminal cleavage/methylation domain-containing protein